MSGKSSRRLRQALRGYRFPVVTQTHSGTDVEADHARSIARIAKMDRVSVDEAIKRYIHRVGMIAKPKAR